MDDPKKVMVRATRGQIEDFMSSFLWKDIKRELGLWKRMCEREAVDLSRDTIQGGKSTASALAHLGSLSGRIDAIDFLLNLPSMFLQIKEEEENA